MQRTQSPQTYELPAPGRSPGIVRPPTEPPRTHGKMGAFVKRDSSGGGFAQAQVGDSNINQNAVLKG
jgi:hypothetical protein